MSALLPVSALLLSVALLLVGNGLQGALLPLRASAELYSSFEIGVLGSSYFIGFATGCWKGPWVVRRVGHIRAFTAMVALASAVILGHSLVLWEPAWWLLRATSGVCFAVLFMVIESWLNERSHNENRGLVFSLYTVINLLSLTLGQLLLMSGEPTGFTLFLIASILVSIAAVPVALTTSPAPAPIESISVRWGKLFRTSPVGVLGCLAVGLANGSFWSLAPVYAQGDSLDTRSVSLFMSVAVFGGAVAQWPLGLLSDRVDRRWVILLACGGGAAAGFALWTLDAGISPSVLGAAAAYGIFAFPLYALSVAHTNDHVEPDGYVEAASGLLMVYALGAVVGPTVASALMRFAGVGGLFAFTGVVHVLTGLLAAVRMFVKKSPSADHQIDFNEAVLVAQTVSTVDPLHGDRSGENQARSAAI